MSDRYDHDIFYPTKGEILSIHQDIIESDEDASTGVLRDGDIDFALDCIQHGHYGEVPTTIHEKAMTLMRLLSANHPFADGNKRTALNTTWTFYALNGLYFDYGEEIKAILKLFAVMERMVDQEEVTSYFEDITYPDDHERVPGEVVQLTHLFKWRSDLWSRIEELRARTEETGMTEQNVEEFEGMIIEFNGLVEGFEELITESPDKLGNETTEIIQGLIEDGREFVEYLIEERWTNEEE